MHWSYLFPKLNKRPRHEIVPPIEPGKAIPRVIHQIYFSNKPMSDALKSNIEALKRMNPEWEHRLYDERSMRLYLEQNYSSAVTRRFDKLNPAYGAALADFFRYLVLYRSGGVYLDIKSSARFPFDRVIARDDQYLISQWRNNEDGRFKGWGVHPEIGHVPGGEFQQWNLAAAPGHPFLKAVIENIIRNIDVYNPALHGTGQLGVLRVTGPIAYTLAIAPILGQHPHKFVDAEEDLGLSYSIFDGESHAKLFREHYSSLSAPVVKLSPRRQASAAILNAARIGVRTARRLARS